MPVLYRGRAVPKGQETDDNGTVRSRACMLGYSRWRNQGNASLLLFTHLCAVKLYYFEVETLFGRMKSSKSYLQVSHNTDHIICCACGHDS